MPDDDQQGPDTAEQALPPGMNTTPAPPGVGPVAAIKPDAAVEPPLEPMPEPVPLPTAILPTKEFAFLPNGFEMMPTEKELDITILKTMGITVGKLQEREHFAVYKDHGRAFVFRGRMDDKGNYIITQEVDLRQERDAGEEVKFRPMLLPIVIPKGTKDDDAFKRISGHENTTTMSEQPMRGEYQTASNASLPNLTNGPKRSV